MAQKSTKTEADTSKMRDIENYTHDSEKRTNIPPVGMAQHDKEAEKVKTYQYDPHIDPSLQWAGKVEGTSFNVKTSSIHIHESIKPMNILSRTFKAYSESLNGQLEGQTTLFDDETPAERMRRRREAVEFYQHGVNWTNRMIAGDSLVIMNSLLEKEGMAGQVQMVYMDPPYGIKYGSNFQPFVNNRDVKETDEGLSQEPEMIKAFRDTWELGIHSYLNYIYNRILLAHELLNDTGSIFIQISDENVHHIRELCDEVFGKDNFCAQINYRSMSPLGQKGMAKVYDYLIWYVKDKSKYKFHSLYMPRSIKDEPEFCYIGQDNGEYRKLNPEEIQKLTAEETKKVFKRSVLTSSGYTESCTFAFEFEGKTCKPLSGKSWRTTPQGIEVLKQENRLIMLGKNPYFRQYNSDFPYIQLENSWTDTAAGFSDPKVYVVQTNEKIIQRCMLMTTDPGDLVLDPTCGSGTTARVAEQWGRRWITCDTSRVAIALAKKRLMTASFAYYRLLHEAQGVEGGFLYKTVPHTTLGTIANHEPALIETLYDQPIIDKSKIRITGPFTVEALPAPTVRPLNTEEEIEEDLSTKQTDWRDQLLATGILGRGGNRLEFSRVEPMSGTTYLQADAETKESNPRRAVVCFAGETKPMDSRMVAMAMDEAETIRPAPKIVIFAAFQFDPEAAKDITETKWPGVECFCVQMNTDLMTEDLKKKRSSDQSFWFVGQPDVELVKDGRSKNKYKVRVNGFDYYDVKKGTVESGSSSRIAMWMLDTDYDGMCIEPDQVFFPMGGNNDGWNKLAKTLRAEIDMDLIEQYAGTESLWFNAQPNSRIAVKIIDDRGIESLKVIRIGSV